MPDGVDVATLCGMRGMWPKREPSYEELREVYKAYYSFGFRSEALRVLAAFHERCGDGVLEIVEALYEQMGRKDGESDRQRQGSLINKVIDISTRPLWAYNVSDEHPETSEDRIVLRITRCPFEDIARKLGLEALAGRMCLAWHKGYAATYGYDVHFPEFLLKGDETCLHVWAKKK